MMFMPARAARPALSGEITPYHSGGCGFWNGSSSIGTSLKLWNRPRWLTVFWVNACIRTAIDSAKISSAWPYSTP
jgi:hypothetical protein